MLNTDKQDVVNLVAILAQLGLRAVVLSPGSRNAPLIRAFNQHPDISCYSIVDERSAGFFAMGLAQQLRKPAAVVCTSGSALLNIAPAAVEAYYQRIPLLVISADRPLEWIGQADGQAMDQYRVFTNFTKGYFECRESKGEKNVQWHNERSAAEAYHLAITSPQGPVHVNVPLSEPLYNLRETSATLLKQPAAAIRGPIIPSAQELSALAAQISESQHVMMLVGQHFPDPALKRVMHDFSRLKQVTVLTETTANLFGNGFIDHIDRTLATIREQEKKSFRPDLLITFGGMVVTKRFKQFLRSNPPANHWQIDTAAQHTDTYQALTHSLHADPVPTLEALLPLIKDNVQSDFGRQWKNKYQLATQLHESYLNVAPFSDFRAFELVLKKIPEHSLLQIGNSTPVRYVQLFSNDPSTMHFCNRGVSGIDGCTSTAAGASAAASRPVVLLSGELSFLYDNNGLWNKYIPKDFAAIVINNQGGNIFRIIEGPDNFEEMPEFIETTHSLSVKPLAGLHGFRYMQATDEKELNDALAQLWPCHQKTILEIFTPREESPGVLKKYWKHLAQGS